MEVQNLAKKFNPDYLYRITDDTGIFQHTKFGVPDREKGYTTDDNARALIAAVLLYENTREPAALGLINTYIAFIHHAQNRQGNFRNFMDYSRSFMEDSGSEDCQGRTVWALGFALSRSAGLPDNLMNTCRYLINQALPHLGRLESPRASAYALIGLTSLIETSGALTYAFPYPHTPGTEEELAFLPREFIMNLIEDMGVKLQLLYVNRRGEGWNWFEDSLTYGNSMLPWALLKAYSLSGNLSLKEAAQESLEFLVSMTFTEAGYYKPIGSHGWMLRGGTAALYDEQPIEACEMLLACKEAAIVLHDSSYLKLASICYNWYTGSNSLNLSLIDPQTGACYDGIHSTGLNLNQGSESIISLSIAHLVMHHE
ncbi:glycosyltransferase [Paenibacillus donghaensis]|uniref:Glycosyltransferase n=1 Tax=Paenibacillus donghaensis TaxID=414771 RepID=A0A2Z2KEP3_9BACL|nr:glycosyltransferase [Paenibacillus donghaensis]ASA25246.1 glycosyltransferase [Paenibacillus donghaensis]